KMNVTRKIDLIVVHCSDSDVKAHDDISVIKEWHLQRGFLDVGYHFFINKNGDIQTGRQLNKAGSHCKGYNAHSVGICLSGRNYFSEQQFNSAALLIDMLIHFLDLSITDIVRHCELNPAKTCPNFSMIEILNRIYSS
ncbi:N-acetylmuramoyl-L-alanine amidase, partial [Candidatus Saccharibacteria bacterium]|nr:N-acetylmuramoyl-L-alanine amidase [Candidatus Saccharibacteria bacterium]